MSSIDAQSPAPDQSGLIAHWRRRPRLPAYSVIWVLTARPRRAYEDLTQVTATQSGAMARSAGPPELRVPLAPADEREALLGAWLPVCGPGCDPGGVCPLKRPPKRAVRAPLSARRHTRGALAAHQAAAPRQHCRPVAGGRALCARCMRPPTPAAPPEKHHTRCRGAQASTRPWRSAGSIPASGAARGS